MRLRDYFSLPANQEEWDGLVVKLVALGLINKGAKVNIEQMKRLFNEALKDFNKQDIKKEKTYIKTKQHH